MGPLHGITVLDVSSVILGPMAGQYLGDMGPDVIKIEAPEGDITRSIGPPEHVNDFDTAGFGI
jgi:crotonobetainyl-CoA:carnitine CoA-transferase CaiB-like acyl-CoA transferase